MPFTLSHPAAVIPLRRWNLIFSALVAGSMAPDYSYYLPLMPGKSFTHSIPGIFLFCLPLGFFVLVLFHKVLKMPLLSLLPGNHRLRLLNYATGFTFLPFKRLLYILISIVIGVITHLLWDAFTHVYGFGVELFPVFLQPLFYIGTRPIAIYTALQHLSTAIGLAIIFIWYWRWYRMTRPVMTTTRNFVSNKLRIAVLFVMLLTALATAVLSVMITFPDVQSLHQLRLFAIQFAIIGISILAAEILAYSIWWQYKNVRNS